MFSIDVFSLVSLKVLILFTNDTKYIISCFFSFLVFDLDKSKYLLLYIFF